MKRLFHVAAAIALAAAQCVFAAETVVPETVLDIGSGAVTLEETEAGWSVRQLGGAAAPAAKVEAFLDALLAGDSSPVPPEAGAAGLADGAGLRVELRTAAGGGGDEVFAIGLHPDGDFDSTYLRTPEGEVVLAHSDLRGALGLWKNSADETPEPRIWLDTRVLRFDPEQVVSLTAAYPDHMIKFTKNGGWTLDSAAPGGEWSEDGLRRWLADLADFRIAGIADAVDSVKAEATPEERAYSIVLGFADGSAKSVRAVPGHGEENAVAVVSGIAGRVFILPQWRFAYYFNRLDSLFPKAAPRFAVEDLRLIDIRCDGESVKITRREEGWEAVALPYAVKAERTERLARLLANWRPEDYADAEPDARPGFGGTTTEVVLADGSVHQYRLGGRHPVFPWRYVTLDGEWVFSVTDAEAEVLFPGFADILEIPPAPVPPDAPEESTAPVAEPEPAPAAPEPAPEPIAPPVEAPAAVPDEAPARKIVPAEVDFSGSVAEKAAAAATGAEAASDPAPAP